MNVIIQNDEVLDVLEGQVATLPLGQSGERELEESASDGLPLEGITGMA